MSYTEAPAAQLVASSCVICNRPLLDAISVERGIGPECAARSGFNTPVDPAVRDEANQIVATLAAGSTEIVPLLNRLRVLGFERLAERIAERLVDFVAVERAPTTGRDEATVAVEAELEAEQAPLPFTLTAGQEQAMEMVGRLIKRTDPSCGFIVGWAGTGKTTTLRAIAREFGKPVIITPTGKAALRVREATGLRASTIHRWIYKPVEDKDTGAIRFVRREGQDVSVPPSRLILLDEASMVGPEVWSDVWDTCVRLNLRLVCVGDGFQLPPVQPGKKEPFSLLTPEFAAEMGAERVELTEILRQALDSPVVQASKMLREGYGLRALAMLPRIQTHQLMDVALATLKQAGIVICHKNISRFYLNAQIRLALGYDEWPREGEPLLVLKNTYEVGLVNGESILFPGWHAPPDPNSRERIYDNWKKHEEYAYFGAIRVGERSVATIAYEELHGRLLAGMSPIGRAAGRWARQKDLYLGENVAPHLHVNFGYAYTAHKSQGSEWPYALICVEPSVRFDEEDGLRWVYTAVTRSKIMSAIYLGRVA